MSLREYKAGAYGPVKQTILRVNLERALHVAIQAQEKAGRGKTIEVAGWKQVLEASQAGQTIEVVSG